MYLADSGVQIDIAVSLYGTEEDDTLYMYDSRFGNDFYMATLASNATIDVYHARQTPDHIVSHHVFGSKAEVDTNTNYTFNRPIPLEILRTPTALYRPCVWM